MGRVYFPTRNDNGVRDLSKSVTLGAYLYDGYRGPAEPAAKAAMNPVNLGSVGMSVNQSGPRLTPIWTGETPPPICPAWGCGAPPIRIVSPAPPVSSQSTPTPQVTVPPAPLPLAVLISSGGGTASPAPALPAPAAPVAQSPTTSTIVTAAPSVTDQVAGWLSGTTPIFSYNVPNALLAAGVALGVALLMGGGGKKR